MELSIVGYHLPGVYTHQSDDIVAYHHCHIQAFSNIAFISPLSVEPDVVLHSASTDPKSSPVRNISYLIESLLIKAKCKTLFLICSGILETNSNIPEPLR